MKVVLAILALMAAFIGYRVAASAAMFQVTRIDVTGTSRTSAEEIEGLTRRAVARTGVWRADLSAISAELGRLPGVRRAVDLSVRRKTVTYVFWLVLVGCLMWAAPVFGVLALVSGLTIMWKAGR